MTQKWTIVVVILAVLMLVVFLVNRPPDPDPDPDPPPDPPFADVVPSVEHLRVDNIATVWNTDADPVLQWESAITLAHICDVSYADPVSVRQKLLAMGFSDVKDLVKGPNCGLVAVADDVVVIAFRGTDEPIDWIANFRFRQIGGDRDFPGAHTGFVGCYSVLAPEIRDFLTHNTPDYIWITGHSLGGAMAVCCAHDLMKRDVSFTGIVTFGQPRVGDETLSGNLETQMGAKYYRFMNEGDPVPSLPPSMGRILPAYWHCGRRLWFWQGKIFPADGVRLRANYADDAAALQMGNLDRGDDSHPSLTDEEFLKLQEGLRELQTGTLDEPAPDLKGKAPAQAQAVDWVVQYFLARINEHKMNQYITKLNTFRRQAQEANPTR